MNMTIDTFCKLCDFKDSSEGPCKVRDFSGGYRTEQEYYVARGLCGWAVSGGVIIAETTYDHIQIRDDSPLIDRDDPAAIESELARARTNGFVIIKSE